MKFLKFPKDFKPIFVDWAITTKCHLNCTHCRYNIKSKVKRQKSKVELNKTQAIKLAKEIKELKPQWILIEGGEPFLRKDIFDIIKTLKPRITQMTQIKKTREPVKSVKSVVTNENPIYIITSGIEFNENLAKKCKETNVKLMISLDSAVPDTYKKIRVGAKLSDAVNAIKITQKYGILDSINFTLQELNASVKEIKAIGKLAKELNVKSMNFLGLKPNSACATNTRLVANFDKLFREITNIGDKYKINVKVDEPFYKSWLKRKNLKPQINTDAHGLKKQNRLNPYNPWLPENGPIVAEEKSGCIFGEYVFIEPDGTTKPCSFSQLSFQEIGFDMIKKIQNKRNRKGKCGKCKFRLACGGCRVRTYTLTGDWLGTDPYCPV